MNRRFYFLTLALFVATVSTALAAQRAAVDAAMTITGATEEGRPHNDVPAAETQPQLQTHDTLLIGSFSLLLAGMVTWYLSVRCGEPGIQSIPAVLMFVAVFLLFIMV